MAVYTVQNGDSLSKIGARYGVSWQSIAQANGIRSPYVIKPGQRLTIPGSKTTPTSPISGGSASPGLVPAGAPDMFNSLIAGVLLYGIYKVLMKVF